MTTPHLRKGLAAVLLACLATACSASPAAPGVTRSASWGLNPSDERSHKPVVIFVISQGLFFDACVVREPLPMHGEFQLLVDNRTNLGPGMPGFLGGRWWEDLNRNGIQDQTDHFFFCPLVLPGRLTP
jgi:hypothetical protein